MARVLIIGASKGIGLETTRQALEAGHWVRAFSRSGAASGLSNANLEKIRGDALDTRDIAAAFDGMDVVIRAALGISSRGDLFRPVSLFSDATRLLVGAMESQTVKRLISVTGFGAEKLETLSHYMQGGPSVFMGDPITISPTATSGMAYSTRSIPNAVRSTC